MRMDGTLAATARYVAGLIGMRSGASDQSATAAGIQRDFAFDDFTQRAGERHQGRAALETRRRRPTRYRHARRLAEAWSGGRHVRLDLASVQTNIVVFHLDPPAIDAATLVAAARERGVLLNAIAARTVRAVTHLDVSREQVERAAELVLEILR